MISNNNINSNMTHLAGLEGGHSPIGRDEKAKASTAQKHPFSNSIFSSITGIVDGVTYTALGVLASPLATGWKGIVGSQADVCNQCYYSMKHFTGDVIQQGADSVYFKKAMLMNGFFKDWIKQAIELESPTLKTFASEVYGRLGGWSVWSQCQLEPSMVSNTVNQCRAANHIAGMDTFIRDNYLLIGAAAVSLVVLAKMYNRYTYEANECQAEDALIKDLKDKYAQIAARIRTGTEDPKIPEMARRILEREFEINEEVAALKLPSLNWKGVEEITEPVFVAARMVAQSSKC